MNDENIHCPICGGQTIFAQKKKKELYVCSNAECSTKLVVEDEFLYMDDTKNKDSEIWQRYRYKRLLLAQLNFIREGERIPEKEHPEEHIKKEKRICDKCGKEEKSLSGFVEIRGNVLCNQCAMILAESAIKEIPITTTLNIDGYKVKKYIDIESVEIVIGTGIFSEIGGEISDFFGARSSAFEKKLQKAKQLAFRTLKYRAFEKGGNAVVGIDIDYTEFSGNRIGFIANGTIVDIEPI